MCGFLLTNLNLANDKQLLSDLALRGPDSKNTIYYPQENITSVFFRLGIIGSKEAAHQPQENDRFIFCFNGEVYNYKTIIKKFELKQSNSDTQTCFELFNKISFDRGVAELDGMFAISLYDKLEKKIHIAVDEFGQKPLYYRILDRKFSICSSLRTIAKVANFTSDDIDNLAIEHYLSFGYFPSEMTPFTNTHRVMPGHITTITHEGVVETKRYRFSMRRRNESLDKDLYNKLNFSLEKSILETALHSDSQYVGVSFSGGLDSSLVCGTLIKNNIDLTAFTVGFPDLKDFDESKNAQNIYHRLGGKNLALINIREKEIEDACISCFDQMDIPIADPSFVATQFVYKAARQQGIKYVIGGDGADELFLGYPNIFAHRVSKYSRWASYIMPHSILKKMKLVKSSSDFPFFRNLSAFINGNTHIEEKYRHFSWPQFNSEYFLSDENHLQKKIEYLLQSSSVLDQSFISLDLSSYLPYDILPKVDMASMGWGVEARSPFLNKTFTKVALAFDPSKNLRQHADKKILKKIAKEEFNIDFQRIKKHGFGFPYKHYLLKPTLKEEVENQIFFCNSKNLVWKNYIVDVWQQIKQGKELSRDFWSLYILNGYLMRVLN